jgi:hypothetical protein
MLLPRTMPVPVPVLVLLLLLLLAHPTLACHHPCG